MQNKKVKFLFGIHMHQPVDNFKEAVDEAVEKCYKPFFEVLKKFPEFKIALHCSGWLLDYIKKNYIEVFLNIKKLSDYGTIEFFTAGFYEPVLSSIPSIDRISQIEKLNKYIKKEFSKIPKGAWLTERVWEDSLINDFVACKVSYAMVDDYHFCASGFDSKNLDGYYFSENDAKKLALFPISKKLRYAIPFKNVTEVIQDIKELYKTKQSVAIIFDDAEKFGLWPGTYEWVYEKGWLEEFFTTVLKDKSIECMHFNEYYQKQKAKGIAYLQNVSYYEMGEWSLRAKDAIILEKIQTKTKEVYGDDTDKFVKGGTWKNFFVKYDESNRLHKRMLEVSKNKVKNKKFLDSLYKLQTNDVFWHGVFGGLYLPNLRDNAYSYLCECENIRYKKKEAVEINDIDMNGYDEVKIIKNNFIIRFDSHYGGQMVEFLQRDKKFNYQNTLTRREESYHQKMIEKQKTSKIKKSKDEIETIHNKEIEVDKEIKDALSFDWYIKNSFIDHISNETFTMENFKRCSFWEYGDFANQPFELIKDKNKIVFKREGGIYFDEKYDTIITKKYQFLKEGIAFDIKINSKSEKEYLYALEFNLHFADLKNVFYDDISLLDDIKFENIKEFFLIDKYTKKKLSFSLNLPFKLLMTPLNTVSQSEKGFELMAQGVSFALIFPFCRNFEVNGVLKVENV